ncbi:MAG: PAS domain S-box protein [Gammaproteobacteria bacterium]|nr:PAS domain S-box protein [Gammaproteobacteria bacterium]
MADKTPYKSPDRDDLKENWSAEADSGLIKAILDNTGALIVVLDGEGRIRRFNRAAEQLSGFSFAEVRGKYPWEILVPAGDAQTVREEAFELLVNNPSQLEGHYTNYWQHKDGRRFLIEWRNTLLRDAKGNVKFVIAIGVDVTERVQAEKALFESEERFRILFENAPEAIVVVDADQNNRFIDANQNACELYKLDRDELLKRGPAELSPPTQPDGQASSRLASVQIQRALDGDMQHFEWTHRDAQGTDIQCEVYLVRLPAAGRRLLRGSVVDISDRKRAHDALRESEQKYRLLFENLTTGFALHEIILDEAGKPIDYRYLELNPAFEKLTGVTSDKLLGKTIKEVMPETEDYWIQMFGKVAITGEPLAYENYSRELGKYYDTWVFSPRKKQFAVIFNDISERKQAETQQADLARVMEESLNEIYILDLQTKKFIKANRAARENLGYSEKEFVELTPLHLNPYRTPQELTEIIKSLQSGRQQEINFESVHQRKDGTTYPVELHIQTGTYADRLVLIAMGNDISERKRAEEERLNLERQVQHAQKLESLGVLSGGIAHDFNNILTSILGFSDLALRSVDSHSIAAEYMQNVVASGQKAAELAKQMLAYSGKGQFDVQLTNLSELVEDIASMLEISISKKCLLQYCLEPDLPAINADATQIRQVIMNLVINASDAIGNQTGVISVRTGVMQCEVEYLKETYLDQDLQAGPYVYLEVKDTGAGMSDSDRQKIFDPFFTTKFTGRGLGLAAVLGIVRGHHGAIKVTSEVGKGSVFKVLFPASTQSVVAGEAAAVIDNAPWQSQGTVLVIDDEESVRHLVRRMLMDMGFNVLEAAGGEEALAIYRRQADDITLVVLDMTMPGLDGIETFKQLQTIQQNVKVIMSSGYDRQTAAGSISSKGLSGFIQKPYRYDELVSVVREVLGE